MLRPFAWRSVVLSSQPNLYVLVAPHFTDGKTELERGVETNSHLTELQLNHRSNFKVSHFRFASTVFGLQTNEGEIYKNIGSFFFSPLLTI